MSMVKQSAPRCRVGDGVALRYGVRKVRRFSKFVVLWGGLPAHLLPALHVDPREHGEAEPDEQPEDFLEPATASG